MTFYTADIFFGNEDIAKRRHFKDVSSMNNEIIENWNSIITPDDKTKQEFIKKYKFDKNRNIIATTADSDGDYHI